METINSATLSAISSGFRKIYLSRFRDEQTVYQQLATVQNTNTLEELFLYLSQLPRMRKWLGERVAQNFGAVETKLKVDDYELTVEVERNHIEDDKLGIYRPLIAEMGRQAAHVWDDLLVEALENGTTNLGFDGQYFFDTDHPTDASGGVAGSQSNKFGSRPLSEDNYAWGRAQMAAYKGADNRPLGVVPTTLIVAPEMEIAARRIVEAEMLDTSAGGVRSNVLRGTAKVLVLNRLSGTTWYLADTTTEIKPFILAVRKQPQFVAKDNPEDDSVFWRKKYHYGVDARGAAGYGPWFLMARFAAS